MSLVALEALRSSSSRQFGQRDWGPLQIQGPGRQYVHDLHSMDIFTFISADVPKTHGKDQVEAL